MCNTILQCSPSHTVRRFHLRAIIGWSEQRVRERGKLSLFVFQIRKSHPHEALLMSVFSTNNAIARASNSVEIGPSKTRIPVQTIPCIISSWSNFIYLTSYVSIISYTDSTNFVVCFGSSCSSTLCTMAINQESSNMLNPIS